MNKRGAALIISYMVITVLTVLGVAFLNRTVSEKMLMQRSQESDKAFWLAEAGLNQALAQLRNSYNLGNISCTSFGSGQYSVSITAAGADRIVTAHGFIPSCSSPEVERVIEGRMSKTIPANFYSNAIYAAGNLDKKGTVDGSIVYAGNITGGDGTEIHNPAISPLALLNFDQLREISKSQNNYHDSDHLNGPFPSSFWYSPGVPNVVFLEGSLVLKGNDNVGGFFVVGGGGDVVYDATLAGNVKVDGSIYTRGNFTIKGGGGKPINISGIWVGEQTSLGGSSVITYSAPYMEAIQSLGIVGNVQVVSWRDTQNPY